MNTTVRHTLLAATFAVALAAEAAVPLQVKVYNAEAGSFHVSSVLIAGPTEALVIDAGFTRADALRIAANVLDSGKRLKAVYVSQADPDYYFGVETLVEIFPQVEIVATPAVLDRIKAKVAAKVAFWGPKMGANAPRNPVLPQALSGDRLSVDGEAVEIRGTTGVLAHRPWVWVPSLRAIVGNIGVFGGLHVWTADTQKPEERRAWVAQLDEMAALKPMLVVPGHMQPGASLDAGNIAHTRDYLKTFESAASTSANAAELIDRMKAAYPKAGLGIALDIGAKVMKGEMAW